jgi:hypothetical protein
MEPCAEPSCPAFATRGAFCPVHAETPLAAARAKEIGHLYRPRYYCGPCDEWFRRSGDCPHCGADLEKGAQC